MKDMCGECSDAVGFGRQNKNTSKVTCGFKSGVYFWNLLPKVESDSARRAPPPQFSVVGMRRYVFDLLPEGMKARPAIIH
jgi:hypothetical protein